MTIEQKIQKLQALIAEAAAKKGRDPAKITVVAATKYTDTITANEAIAAGIKCIGENRLQDAQKKLSNLLPVHKHFIGHLQQNKVKKTVEIFDLIESVDSFELAQKIDEVSQKLKKKTPICLEVNIAGDNKKFGLAPEKTLSGLRQISELHHIELKGLMTIVPFFKNPEETRPYFREMKGLFDLCLTECPSLEILSMGMSHDFMIAIEEGATEIRIGQLIFGEKPNL